MGKLIGKVTVSVTDNKGMQFPTFQVQVLGSIDALACCGSVYLQCVSVAVVSGDGYIVPLIVIQRPFTFAFDQIGSISKVKHVVDVSARTFTI